MSESLSRQKDGSHPEQVKDLICNVFIPLAISFIEINAFLE